MKTKYFLTIIILQIACFSCKAQDLIISGRTHYTDTPVGGYYKDQNNLLNPYIGTWVYTNGNTSITIQLRKLTHKLNLNIYEDVLVGEYIFVENGVEIFNTLDRFNLDLNNYSDYNINGNTGLLATEIPKCTDCNLGILRFELTFNDSLKGVLGSMYFGISQSDNNKAVVFINSSGLKITVVNPSDPSFDTTTTVGTTIPNGWYLFIKQ